MQKSLRLKYFLIALTILVTVQTNAQDRAGGRTFVTRSEVIAQHGMAATSQPLATQAAIDILKQGGNAIDAAIAANAVLGVTEPHVNGIGGDIYVIIYEAKTGKLHGLNVSGVKCITASPGNHVECVGELWIFKYVAAFRHLSSGIINIHYVREFTVSPLYCTERAGCFVSYRVTVSCIRYCRRKYLIHLHSAETLMHSEPSIYATRHRYRQRAFKRNIF